MRILLAEDEKRMAAALAALLRQEKYDVDHVEDGASALTALESGVYDIAVLDVMMPEMNGFEAARRARSGGVKTPILMLTAKSQLEDKVTGLDSGADDYLTKPFQTKELLARLRALGRRSASFRDGNLHFGDLTLDVSKATLACERTGQNVRLSEKELHILEYMFSNQGQIMTREQLAVKIWGFENEAEYNNVEVYIKASRTSPETTEIWFRRDGIGLYSYFLSTCPFNSDEKEEIMKNLSICPYNEHVLFEYAGAAFGSDNFPQRDEYLKKHQPW